MYMCMHCFNLIINSYCVILYLAHISSSTDLYFVKHIGLQLAVELHNEIHIQITTNKDIFF